MVVIQGFFALCRILAICQRFGGTYASVFRAEYGGSIFLPNFESYNLKPAFFHNFRGQTCHCNVNASRAAVHKLTFLSTYYIPHGDVQLFLIVV